MQFPRTHIIIIAGISLGMASFVIAKFNGDDTDNRFNNDTVLASLPISETTIAPATELLDLPLPLPAAAPTAVKEEAPQQNPLWQEDWREVKTKVRPGDNLALIFKRHNLTPQEVYAVSQSKPLGTRLKSIFPGHELSLFVNEVGQLMAMNYATGPLDTLIFEREGKNFASHQVTATPETVMAYKHGVIDHSLFVASQRAGLTDNLTMRLAQIFQWDVDFVLDIRPGDAFYVLFEELYHQGEFVGHGKILAAEFVNQGDHYRAIQYISTDGDSDYFSPDGNSMRKAFLRAPVSFSRISSNFNLRRVHPLFKEVRPHRGIDYAAPQGTPILAAGDGRITHATKTKANGNYVVIQHGEQFVTKYLHLSKFGRGVQRGTKVSQGQVIGEVGATGWATAPHLHYEFLVNGVHKNPRTVSLPDARPINANEMPRFQEHTQTYAALLDNYKSQVSVALAR
ncbi:MAG: murein DD-endopeptidase MepM/ murein hydrolase activator NlpD [Candidatus Azotimanducaceae bacterium]|jgi:murein DD-endopeptidase MepM/ murein hydrolase activator NlpD